ncbi:MAG: hypothetical protein AB7O97_11995 [Planctomycetota bacterium]
MSRTIIVTTLAALVAAGAPAQQWTAEELVEHTKGFDQEALPLRLQQVSELLTHQQEAFAAMTARIHGDHREYLLKIDRLIGELSDARWSVREQAEQTLIEVGARAKEVLRQRIDAPATLEEGIRCSRVLDAINARGTEEEEREARLLRGLVTTTQYMQADERLLRALRSALGHTDPQIVGAAIRALGAHGGDDEATAVAQLLDWKGGIYRDEVLAALSRMPSPRALALCTGLVEDGDLTRAETCAMLAELRRRADAAPLLQRLRDSDDAMVAAAARMTLPASAPTRAQVVLTIAGRTSLGGTFAGFVADGTALEDAVPGLSPVLIGFQDSDILDFPAHTVQASDAVRVFLTQGSLVTGDLVAIDATTVRLRSPVFGVLDLPRASVQGIAVDPQVDRLVGASVEHDRVRLRTNDFVDGTIVGVADGKVRVLGNDGREQVLALGDVAGLLTTRPRTVEPDATVYARVDLTNGDRVIGFLAGSTRSHLLLAAPELGAAVVPIEQVSHVEIGVGGGAMWGFTLIADYSDNRIVEVDEQGREQLELKEVFGAWDAECLDNGHLLITEFSVSRVQEVDRKGNVIWSYDQLKNPYDADRLPNGNTLIADTFAMRVIEVTPEGGIAWKYDQEIRPFDCDRLPNGNTLIADVIKDRVIEVSPAGEIVWEVKGMNNVHDADRLPNGNTLITLRSRGAVIEVDRDGKVVWELTGLSSPSDADRLPNGHTLVAENTQVREFDRNKNVVWRQEMTWAVEVNRY